MAAMKQRNHPLAERNHPLAERNLQLPRSEIVPRSYLVMEGSYMHHGGYGKEKL